ncbi:MAG: glutathione S-transferase family protein [Pseudomonadota bacterium]
MYTLYGMTGSCSMAVHVVLNELGETPTMVDVRVPDGQPRPAEFLAINPRGNVPVLVDGDIVLREGGAIISYLLDKHDSPMLPKSGAGRAKALEWLMFANASMHPAYGRVFFTLRTISDAAAKEEALTAALAQIDKLWADVDAQLAKTSFICGNEVSAADILLAVIANWGMDSFAKRLTLGDNVKRMLRAVTARPAYQTAIAQEHVVYKAAA